MPKVVVDPLEAIDIDERNDEGVPRPGAPGYLALQGDEASAALQDTGQLVALKDLALLVCVAALVSSNKTVARGLAPVEGRRGSVHRRLLALSGCLVPEQGQVAALPKVDDPGRHLPFRGVGLAVAFVGLLVAFISLTVPFAGQAIALVCVSVAPVVGEGPQFGGPAAKVAPARGEPVDGCKAIAHVGLLGSKNRAAEVLGGRPHRGSGRRNRPAQTPTARSP
jgi:hypothetical protein